MDLYKIDIDIKKTGPFWRVRKPDGGESLYDPGSYEILAEGARLRSKHVRKEWGRYSWIECQNVRISCTTLTYKKSVMNNQWMQQYSLFCRGSGFSMAKALFSYRPEHIDLNMREYAWWMNLDGEDLPVDGTSFSAVIMDQYGVAGVIDKSLLKFERVSNPRNTDVNLGSKLK